MGLLNGLVSASTPLTPLVFMQCLFPGTAFGGCWIRVSTSCLHAPIQSGRLEWTPDLCLGVGGQAVITKLLSPFFSTNVEHHNGSGHGLVLGWQKSVSCTFPALWSSQPPKATNKQINNCKRNRTDSQLGICTWPAGVSPAPSPVSGTH